jgi:hypothetical protein
MKLRPFTGLFLSKCSEVDLTCHSAKLWKKWKGFIFDEVLIFTVHIWMALSFAEVASLLVS